MMSRFLAKDDAAVPMINFVQRFMLVILLDLETVLKKSQIGISAVTEPPW